MSTKVLIALLAIFAISALAFPADAIPPDEVTAYSASRTQRHYHNLFHQVRMLFKLCDAIEQSEIANLGWAPLNFAQTYTEPGNPNSAIMIYEDTGADFLYMHRKMIGEVNAIAEEAGSSWRVTGWEECPTPTDEDWPVPPNVVLPDVWYQEFMNSMKTDDFYTNTIVPTQRLMNDPTHLRSLNIGEFGSYIEFDLHTWFHVRFSEVTELGMRVQNPTHPTAYVDPKWDVEEYILLGDFYSAHVNPTFWMIHGWIEKMIAKWMDANDVDEITWMTYWDGGPIEQIEALNAIAQNAIDRENKGNASEAGQVVGAVVGGTVIAILILLIGYVCMKKTMAKNQHNHQPIPAKEVH